MAIAWTEPLVVKINSVDRTSSIARDSVRVEQTASTRATAMTTASFKVLDGAAFSLAELQTVSIENDDASTVHFRGFITSLSETQIKGTQLNYDVSCANYTWQLEHVEEIWDHEHTDETDNDIITEALDVTNPDINTTVYVEELDTDISENFDKVTGREVLDRLAERINAIWYVDNGPVDIDDITNEALNPGFETAGAGDPDFFANWTETAGNGAIADEGVIVNAGSHACKLTTGADWGTKVVQLITVKENWDYSLGFSARGDGTEDGAYSVYDETNAAFIIAVTQTGQTAASYAYVSNTFTVPTGCTSISIRFYGPPSENNLCYFDSILLRRVYQVHLHYFVSPLDSRAELITNGGFETAGGGGADIWTGWAENAGDGALANETSLVYAGDDAAKLTCGAGDDTNINETITVMPGIDYTLQTYTRGDGSTAGRYDIYDITGSAYIVASKTTTGVAGATYTLLEKDFTTPAGCVSILVRFWPGGTNGDIAYFDAVSLLRNYDTEWQLLGDTYAATGSYYTDLRKEIRPPEANRVRVLGAGAVDETRTTGARADYGQWITVVVRNKDCKDATQAQTYGDNYLAYKQPDPTYSCRTYRHGIFAGQVVELTNSFRSLTSEVLDVKRVSTQWHGVHDGGSNWVTSVDLELGKFKPQLADKMAEMARAAKRVPDIEWKMDHLDFTGSMATDTHAHTIAGTTGTHAGHTHDLPATCTATTGGPGHEHMYNDTNDPSGSSGSAHSHDLGTPPVTITNDEHNHGLGTLAIEVVES